MSQIMADSCICGLCEPEFILSHKNDTESKDHYITNCEKGILDLIYYVLAFDKKNF